MIVRLVWWNAQNFAHYDPTRVGERRWPQSPEAFSAKLELLSTVLGEHIDEHPIVIALGEATQKAAEALRDRLRPTYRVFSLDFLDRAAFHVAFIYPPDDAFVVQTPFTPQFVPSGTRPMGVLDLSYDKHKVRTIACHWTARFNESSEKARSDTARDLSRYIFDFLNDPQASEQRHVVVLGDLNEEPFGLVERDLYAQRERWRAKRRHKSDEHLKRQYLYNISWRMLGERFPFATAIHESAGTYYWEEENVWRTFDHIIVDGSLVGDTFPRVDEGATQVVAHPELFRVDRVPTKFWWDGTKASGGVSDHLPVTTILRLADTNA